MSQRPAPPAAALPSSDGGGAGAPAAPEAPKPKEQSEATAPPLPVAAFPPPDITPPSARSAAPGDGHYSAFGDPSLGERAATTPPLVVRTVLHPHPESRFITVTIAAIDLSRAAVRLEAGTDDLAWAKLDPQGGGLVPESDRPALALVFNGGFQPKHGHWGLVANRVVVSKPREDGCSILLDDSGAVRIGPSSKLAAEIAKAASVRQAPPCLVDSSAVHPSLLAGNDKAWAGHAADLRTRRRSALGLNASGTVLFYAVGEEAEPRHLADALALAGAAEAAELDINWYWTRFLLFGDAGGTLRVTSTLIPKMEHLTTEYVERASIRDFFYVVRR